jgi:hypothetical protein
MGRYFDVNSLYRNRLLYPSVCDFVIQMNTNSVSTSASAQDPVLLAFPYETNLLQGGSTVTQLTLSVQASNIVDYYKKSFIEIFGFFRQIIAYDPSLKIVTVDTPFPAAYLALTPYTIRYELPQERDFTGGPSPALNQIVLHAGASSIDQFYRDKWIFLPGATPPSSYVWRRIKSYNGATKVATVTEAFPALIPAGQIFEVLLFSYDNVKALKYLGTEVGTNNAKCMRLNLINLIVPNLPVANSYQGTLQNYPFLYVCIFSEYGLTYTNPLVSSAPAANQALFKVPVSYLQNISYLSLGYAGMSPEVSFRMDDTLRYRILLPDGDILRFVTPTGTSYIPGTPVPPNPVAQVQLTFEITPV